MGGDAHVLGNALLCGKVSVGDNAFIDGNARISDDSHIVWFSRTGPWSIPLTCFRGEDENGNAIILVNKLSFLGTDTEFLGAVEKEHGEDQFAKEYRLLIEVARLRILV